MKNIFTRALALTIVFALCAVSAFAAPAFTTDGVVYDLEAGTIDVATEGYTAGKSATLLVVKDGANLASLAASDIIYIDQEDNLAATTQAWTDIPLADRIAALNAAKAEGAADITAVNVYIGGTDVTAAIPYADEDGNPLSIAVAEEEEPEVTYTYAVTFNTASTEFASVDAAVAALVVTKNGSDGSTATLTTADYTTDTATANTIKVLVGGEEIGSIAYTIAAPVEPPVTGKTAIAGTVTYTARSGATPAKGATVVITEGADVAGYAVTNAEGKYEVELPAGTYRAIVNFIRFNANGTFDENVPQIITDIVVTEGATTTKDVAISKAIVGDLDADGDVDGDDFGIFAGKWTGKIN